MLVASLLCGMARPAFADGAIPTEHEINVFLLKAGLVALAIVVVVVGVFWLVMRLGRSDEAATQEQTTPELPAARTVRERR
jgi:heme/copper-type cytochrome/quinol oxidase subunit 2